MSYVHNDNPCVFYEVAIRLEVRVLLLHGSPTIKFMVYDKPVRDQEPYFLLCYSKEPHHVYTLSMGMNVTRPWA